METHRRQLHQDLPKPDSTSATATVGVYAAPSGASERESAERLASELNLPLVAPADGSCDLHLVVTDTRVELRPTSLVGLGPIFVDFTQSGQGGRLAGSGGSRQPLARALALRRGKPQVLDATVGLGADAFLIARLGCTVTAVERTPAVHCLLRDGLRRAQACADRLVRETAARITLVQADAREVLAHLQPDDAPDVVYLDPMYPPRKKASALARKQMRILRLLAGDDEDAGDLLRLARQVARRRVVVKRQRHAPPLARDRVVTHGGKTTRYDVYLPCRPPDVNMG